MGNGIMDSDVANRVRDELGAIGIGIDRLRTLLDQTLALGLRGQARELDKIIGIIRAAHRGLTLDLGPMVRDAEPTEGKGS